MRPSSSKTPGAGRGKSRHLPDFRGCLLLFADRTVAFGILPPAALDLCPAFAIARRFARRSRVGAALPPSFGADTPSRSRLFYCILCINNRPCSILLRIVHYTDAKKRAGKALPRARRMTFAGVFAKGMRPTGSLLWGAGFSPRSGWSSSQAASALPVSAPAGAERRSRKRP